MSDWAADIRKLFQKIKRDMLLAVFAVTAIYIVFGIIGIGCPIKWTTGISCAGCGMTRAYLSLLHLDIKHAFIYHPLFWSVPLVLLIFVLYMMGRVSARTANCIKYLTAFLFILVYVVRLLDPEDTIVVASMEEGLAWRVFNAVRQVFA